MIRQLLTLGLVTAGVTWLAKSRHKLGGDYESGVDSMGSSNRTGSGSTSRSMRSSMKSDTAGSSYGSSSSASSRTDSGSGAYNNPTASGTATRSSTSTATPGTYGPGSSSRQ